MLSRFPAEHKEAANRTFSRTSETRPGVSRPLPAPNIRRCQAAGKLEAHSRYKGQWKLEKVVSVKDYGTPQLEESTLSITTRPEQ